uniref:NADH dehydrogenase [ubiquinone] 1 beta subcomplex subunit 4 n=1 Tax=Mus spicilegus TaxID=10103 RepID=A0A8C6MT50_MUSSI
MSGSKYKPAPLATLPSTLDPAEYDVSPETRRAQVERLSIRARLKREYLLQYNDPKRGSDGFPPGLEKLVPLCIVSAFLSETWP